MKTSRVWPLVGLLMTYMRRRVFSQGPLRDPLFRIGAAIVVLLSLAALTAGALLFLRPVLGEGGNLQFTVRLASISTVYWTIFAFLFVRVLFSRSSDMMKFTWQLPLTNRERSAALGLFEAIVVLGITLAVFIPLAVSVLLLTGGAGLLLLLEGIAFPAAAAFAALSLANNAVMLLLNAVKLSRVAPLASLVVSAAFLGVFTSMSQPLASAMTEDFLQTRLGYHATDAFVSLGMEHGDLVAVLVFAVIAAPLAYGIWLTIPRSYTPARKFFAIRLPTAWTSADVGAYLLAWIRRTETWIAVLAAYSLAGILVVQAPDAVAYSMGILTAQALYQYSATRSLRRLPNHSTGPGRILFLLLASQGLGVLAMSVPIILLAVSAGTPATTMLVALGSCASGIVLLNLLGILFPLDRDNPFSAVVSYLLCLLAIAVLVVVMGVLNLPAAVTAVLLAALHASALFYSHLGIRMSQRKARFA